jgi:hypothetical protein
MIFPYRATLPSVAAQCTVVFMSLHVEVNARIFRHATAARIGRVALRNLEAWQRQQRLGEVGEREGGGNFLYSVMDIAKLRLISALTGPVIPPADRQFMMPGVAADVVDLFIPLDDYLGKDDCGFSELKSIDDARFLVVHVKDREQHATAEVLSCRQTVELLGAMKNQALVVPLTLLVYEVFVECTEQIVAATEVEPLAAKEDQSRTYQESP